MPGPSVGKKVIQNYEDVKIVVRLSKNWATRCWKLKTRDKIYFRHWYCEKNIKKIMQKKVAIMKKIDAFSAQSETLSALKVKSFKPNLAIFFTHFFQH